MKRVRDRQRLGQTEIETDIHDRGVDEQYSIKDVSNPPTKMNGLVL